MIFHFLYECILKMSKKKNDEIRQMKNITKTINLMHYFPYRSDDNIPGEEWFLYLY